MRGNTERLFVLNCFLPGIDTAACVLLLENVRVYILKCFICMLVCNAVVVKETTWAIFFKRVPTVCKIKASPPTANCRAARSREILQYFGWGRAMLVVVQGGQQALLKQSVGCAHCCNEEVGLDARLRGMFSFCVN